MTGRLSESEFPRVIIHVITTKIILDNGILTIRSYPPRSHLPIEPYFTEVVIHTHLFLRPHATLLRRNYGNSTDSHGIIRSID